MHRHSQGHRHGQSRGHKRAHRHIQTHITLAEAKGSTNVETPRLLEGCEARLYPTFVDQSSHKASRHCRPIRPQIEKPIHSSHGHQHLDTGLLAPPVLQASCAGGPSDSTGDVTRGAAQSGLFACSSRAGLPCRRSRADRPATCLRVSVVQQPGTPLHASPCRGRTRSVCRICRRARNCARFGRSSRPQA